MSGWWIADYLNTPGLGPVFVVSWIVWVIGSIILHELGHGVAAIKLGDRTPIELGHMTWNPLVHMGGMSLVMFAIVGIAWGAMPVNPSRLRGRHADAMVALAGPLVNLILAIMTLVALPAWTLIAGPDVLPSIQAAPALYQNMQTFLGLGAMLNIILMIFNLMPVVPLDGGRILGHFWPAYARFAESENGRWAMLALFIIVFFSAGDYIFPLSDAVVGAVNQTIQNIFMPTPA